MSKQPINVEAETKHTAQMHELSYNAMLQLRDTLGKNFNASELGYKDSDDARLQIVKMTIKQMDSLSAAHLRKYG